jgi:hypothetical protein
MSRHKRNKIFNHITNDIIIDGKTYNLNHVKDYQVDYRCSEFNYKILVWVSTHVYTKGITELNNSDDYHILYEEYNVKRYGNLVPIEYRVFDKKRYQLSLQLKRIIKNEFNDRVFKKSDDHKILSIPLNDTLYLIVFTLERQKNRFILKIISAYEHTNKYVTDSIKRDIDRQNKTIIEFLKELKTKKP